MQTPVAAHRVARQALRSLESEQAWARCPLQTVFAFVESSSDHLCVRGSVIVQIAWPRCLKPSRQSGVEIDGTSGHTRCGDLFKSPCHPPQRQRSGNLLLQAVVLVAVTGRIDVAFLAEL